MIWKSECATLFDLFNLRELKGYSCLKELSHYSLIFLMLLLFGFPVIGELTPFEQFTTEERVSIKADKMYYDQKKNLYYAEGNVAIEQQGAVLKARYHYA